MFELKTEYSLLKAMFSTNGHYILCLGSDGFLRILDWKVEQSNKIISCFENI